MSRRIALQLVFHGLLLVLLGMLVGLPFHDAITRHAGPDSERAWRVAHTSLVGGGTFYLALAAAAPYLVLSQRATSFAAWSLVVAAWTFAFGFVIGPAVGARGLEPLGPPLHLLVFAALVVGLTLLLVATSALLWGAWNALRSEDEG